MEKTRVRNALSFCKRGGGLLGDSKQGDGDPKLKTSEKRENLAGVKLLRGGGGGLRRVALWRQRVSRRA